MTMRGFYYDAPVPTEPGVTVPALMDELGRTRVAERFTGGAIFADQAGADGVILLDFGAPMDLIWVRSDGANSRCDPFGGTPSATTGILCDEGSPIPLTITAQVVRVYAPTGATVRVWAFSYGDR